MSTTPRRPRVVHIVPSLFRKEGGVLGGAERYALELARAMARRTPTTLYSFGPRPETFKIDDLDVRIFRPTMHVRSRDRNPVSAAMLASLGRFDVVHCHQRAMVYASLSALVARAVGRKAFVSDLGGGAWDFSAFVSTERWFRGHLHISAYSRSLFPMKAPARHHVIMGGVDVEKFSPDPSVQRGRSILFVGRLMPHKGVIDLIDAVEPGMRLELIGQPYHERYYEDLKAAASGKDVVFRHECDDAQIVEAYRRAVAVVLPSVYEDRYGGKTLVPELLGQTLLEGMACGTPAVCTDVASMPEVVADDETGYVVPPNDPPALRAKLRHLLDHPAEVEALGLAARRRVLDVFQWDGVVDRCFAAYGVDVPASAEPPVGVGPAA